MNSRSSVNETNLVNYSTDISTLNQLDTKDSLLSFPFDHIYACHSETDRRQTLQLDKEVEISTHCVVAEDKDIVDNNNTEISRLTDRLVALENQNKKLKDLLKCHLDLIQQQNEIITKKDKLHQELKQENDTLKLKLIRFDKRVSVAHRHNLSLPSLGRVPASTVTSSIIENVPSASSKIMLNNLTELVLPDNRANSLIFDSNLNKPKPFGQQSFDLPSNTATVTGVTSYLSTDLGVPSILDSNLNRENYTMIENKRSFVNKEMKTENRSEALYTVTTNSGNPVIQRIQRNRRRSSTGIGSLSRMNKTPVIKTAVPETSKVFVDDKSYDRSFSVNKKSKMINTYGKSRLSTSKRTSQFTGSLSDRLRLIDTTPTGEDPYQLGEADMREQSPIPKLMLQKTNHARMKMCTETSAESTAAARRLYGITIPEKKTAKSSSKVKTDYSLSSNYIHAADIKTEPQSSIVLEEAVIVKPEPDIDWRIYEPQKPDEPKLQSKTLIVHEPDLDIVKTEPEIDWRLYNLNKPGNETSVCDFSYGETPNNLASHILPQLDPFEFQDLFPSDSLQLENLSTSEYSATVDKNVADKSKQRGARTSSLMGSHFMEEELDDNKDLGADSKRGRKRALSAAGLVKPIKRENSQKGIAQKPKLAKTKTGCRGKKSPLPGMVTTTPYHTLVGDPDLSWYVGLDPDVKVEDIDHGCESKVSTVEVPRWREKPYTSTYTLEGTENLDDKVFEKRHQKLEAEERRQLRWHMRRIREQRHVDRLRQRQRHSWCVGGGSPAHAPAEYTIWPHPQRDVRFIEITDVLPVMAFGEILPALPESDFMLPWVRSSKALKRSKRSKTLH